MKKNPNKELLEGIACPNRKCEEPYRKFTIRAFVDAEVTDQNAEASGGVEWDDSSQIWCDSCGETGTVETFKR